MRFFRKVYKYAYGKIRVRSDIPLGDEEITFIINTINNFMDKGYYEPCYQISREIYYNLTIQEFQSVEAYTKFGKFFVNISK